MPGRRSAGLTGKDLEDAVFRIAQQLGLEVTRHKSVGRRLWGPKRQIDLVVSDPETRRQLGIECKAQATTGTAEEKIPAIILDIAAWPIPGIVCFNGPGFSEHMKYYLRSTGKAVDLEDLQSYLELFFGVSSKTIRVTGTK